jgi:hypothetical protein
MLVDIYSDVARMHRENEAVGYISIGLVENFPPVLLFTVINEYLKREGVPYTLESYECKVTHNEHEVRDYIDRYSEAGIVEEPYKGIAALTFKRIGIAELISNDQE